MLKKYITIFLIPIFMFGIGIGVPGCAAFLSELPTMVAAVSDAVLILETIEKFAGTYFTSHPDSTSQTKITAALQKARNALMVAEHALSAADEVNHDQFYAAIKDFGDAYQELMVLVGPLGVKEASPGLKAGPNELLVPRPNILGQK